MYIVGLKNVGPGVIGVGGSLLGGAVAGARFRAKNDFAMTQQIQRDLWHLGSDGHLPEALPSFRLTPRRQVNIFLCYIMGIVGSGFVAWLLTVIITAAILAGWDSPDNDPNQRLTAPLFAGFVVGTVALLVPGTLVGAAIWLREVRKRITEATAVAYREYWSQRQHGAQALANGQATPHQVATVLAGHYPGPAQ